MAHSSITATQRTEVPVSEVRHYLEPGPIVLVTSAWKERSNVMTMGWHTVMEFTPSLVGCVISRANHSHAMVRKSGECAINIPEARWVDRQYPTESTSSVGNSPGITTSSISTSSLCPSSRCRMPGGWYTHDPASSRTTPWPSYSNSIQPLRM